MKVHRRFRIVAGLYGVIWISLVVIFWLFCRTPQMAMLYVIAVQYIILPSVTFILSFLIGKEPLHIKYFWFIPIIFSIAHLLCKLLTLSVLQLLLAGVASFPNIYDFLALVLISAAGLLIGFAWSKLCKKSA